MGAMPATATPAPPLSFPIACDWRAMQKARIEGPTRKQAIKMAARRLELLALAHDLVGRDDDRAFEFDCEAWDIERDLEGYGFDLAGKPVRS